MENNIAIRVHEIHKSFKIPHEKSVSLKSAALNIFKRKTYTKYQAAKGISFEVKQGEFFGIIGRNGCGKSTMLKMIGGIYLPDQGKIEIEGNLSPFLELGVGFNPELSARDNVYLNGTILGLRRNEIDEKFDEIIEFAELEQFVDQKLKNYSSGMQVRLAFSVAIHAHAEILLIDEVLAVGDTNFQKKCFNVFKKFKDEGKTIVFVTHSMNYVRDFCDRVAVLEGGKLIYLGEPEMAIDRYNKLNAEKTEVETQNLNEKKAKEQVLEDAREARFGSGKGKINGLRIVADSRETRTLKTNEKFTIEVEIKFYEEVINPVLGVMFRPSPQENLYGITTLFNSKQIGKKKAGDAVVIEIEDRFPLNEGEYAVKIALTDQPFESIYEELDIIEEVTKVNVISSKRSWGRTYSEPKIKIVNK